jgi:Rha family phage regulatory protein
MAKIEALDCSKEFATLNFKGCSYDDRGREMPMYEMTRDGWSFLVMGFTGKKAAWGPG